MDPLTSLSIVGNVVQLVTFGSKLIHATLEVSGSLTGSTKANEELKQMTTHLRRLCDQVIIPVTPTGTSNNPILHDDRVLWDLAKQCKVASEDLLGALRTLEAEPQGKRGKWRTVKAALATIWKKKDIEGMERRLESYKSLINLELAQRANR